MAYSKNLGRVKGNTGSFVKPNAETEAPNKVNIKWTLEDEERNADGTIKAEIQDTSIEVPYYVPVISERDPYTLVWKLNTDETIPAEYKPNLQNSSHELFKPPAMKLPRGEKGMAGLSVEPIPEYASIVEQYKVNNPNINEYIARIKIHYNEPNAQDEQGNQINLYGKARIEEGILFLMTENIDNETINPKKAPIAYVYEQSMDETVKDGNGDDLTEEITVTEQVMRLNPDGSIKRDNNGSPIIDLVQVTKTVKKYQYLEKAFIKIESPIDLTDYYTKDDVYNKSQIDCRLGTITEKTESTLGLLDEIDLEEIHNSVNENAGIFEDLQELINNANAGDTIILTKDYKNNGSENEIEITKAIKIIGNGHIIDADGQSKILNIQYDDMNDNSLTELIDVVFINGYSEQEGGAIDNYVNLSIQNCTFAKNTANEGAALCNHSEDIEIINTIFESNSGIGDIKTEELYPITTYNCFIENISQYVTNKPYLTEHQDISNKIDTAGTGLSKNGTTLNHSNSIEAKTGLALRQFSYDENGHITNSAIVNIDNIGGGGGSLPTGTFTELQELIDDCNPGEAVILNKDYYNDSNESAIEINKNIIIEGKSHAIDANGVSRIFNISGGTVCLNNLLFTEGNASGRGGGLVINDPAKVLITNSSFVTNQCSGNYGYGGAIDANNNTIVINCTFDDNLASKGGGAICGGTAINCQFNTDNDTTCGETVVDNYATTQEVTNRIEAYLDTIIEELGNASELISQIEVNVEDNLNSTSTTSALSANQGKVLRELINGKAALEHNHGAIQSNGTINDPIQTVNNIVVTDANNSAKTISKLPSNKVTHQDISGKENTSNKTNIWSSTPSTTKYPTERLVKTELDKKETLSNKITSWSSTPSVDKYPAESLIRTELDKKINSSNIVNNYNSNSASVPLSASRGQDLNNRLNALDTRITNIKNKIKQGNNGYQAMSLNSNHFSSQSSYYVVRNGWCFVNIYANMKTNSPASYYNSPIDLALVNANLAPSQDFIEGAAQVTGDASPSGYEVSHPGGRFHGTIQVFKSDSDVNYPYTIRFFSEVPLFNGDLIFGTIAYPIKNYNDALE